jgi:cold shock CspA family protein/ribosome-associated translation inhibitor RaiA
MLELQIKLNEVADSPDVESYIRERAAHLDDFYESILTCRVILEAPVGHHRKGGPFEVKVDLDVPGAVITVNRQSADDLHVAIRNAFDAAGRQLEDYARRQREEWVEPEKPPRGRVVRLFPEEGFGFLATEDDREVYFHRNSVLDGGFDELKTGDEVRFAEEEGDKGPQASSVIPAGR